MAEGQQRQQEQLRPVALVNIEEGSDAAGIFEEMYEWFVRLLKRQDGKSIRLINVSSAEELGVTIEEEKPKVLIFTNEVVAGKEFKQLDAVKKFIAEGGLVILACHFSSFVRPLTLNSFFNSLGLPWKSGEYNRTSFRKTDVGKILLDNVSIKTDDKITLKATQLLDVAPEHKLYVPVDGARISSTVFGSYLANPNLTMAAFGRIGKGAVAYVGDFNAEEEASLLAVALCLVNW